MNFEDIIYGRRTVRQFCDKLVEKEKIYKLIDAARYAPSASNKQAWKFIIIDDVQIKEQICKYNGSVVTVGKEIIMHAPVGIMVLYRNDVSKNYKLYKDTIQSAAAAIQNIQLMAFNEGLGTCWICKLPLPKKLKVLLEIPRNYDIIAYIGVGYPDERLDEHTIRHFDNSIEEAQRRKRKYSLDEIVSYNSYSSKCESIEGYKFTNLICWLQTLQLKLNNNKKSFLYPILKKLLLLLGEKWV